MDKKNLDDNLCDHCMFHPAECDAEIIKWGDGKGNDNVLECDCHKEPC